MESIFRHNANPRLQTIDSPSFTEVAPPNGDGVWLVSPLIKIKNRLGLHARAAAMVAKAMEPFQAEVFLVRDSFEVDAKSVLSLLTLGCPYDSQVRVKTLGQDAAQALALLVNIINDRFGEQ